MASDNIRYVPITVKSGEPIPANAFIDFTGQWYVPVSEDGTEIELVGPADPEEQFCAQQLAAAWETYYTVQDEFIAKYEKKYQAERAKREAAHQALLRELDF